jgi:hypothetical protein
MSDASRRKVSAVTGCGLLDETLSNYLAPKNREMQPWSPSSKFSKMEVTSSSRQWTFVAPVKKTSLLFDCLGENDGLARAGYNMTWPAWTLLQSKRYCVFIDPVELYLIVIINKYFNMGCVTFRSPVLIYHMEEEKLAAQEQTMSEMPSAQIPF